MKPSKMIVALSLFAIPTLVGAAEIASNGLGGGTWSDPATWRNKAIPGPRDDVVVQKFDVVVFDRNDDGKVSCGKLQIDPKGVFMFKTGAGKLTFCVAEAIDNYGIIKVDGTRSAADLFEIRMIGSSADKRKLKLSKGAGLLLYGRANLPGGKRNVALNSPRLPDQKEDITCVVDGDGNNGIDWQRAKFDNVKLMARSIDNTGAKQHERFNVVDNQFTGEGRIWGNSCDSPVISRNTFEYKGEKGARLPAREAAIYLNASPLSEFRGNNIRGGFYAGIHLTNQSDAVMVGNIIDNCDHGISVTNGPTTLVKQCQIKNCDTGIFLQNGSGVVEDTIIDGGKTGFEQTGMQLQLTNVHFKNLGPKTVVVKFDSGSLSLLNCNVTPKEIKLGPPPAKSEPEPPVTCLQYVVVAAKKAPPGALVEVRTAAPAVPADAADANVRNSPAPLPMGLSPLPKTLNPLIVKAWSIDDKGKILPAPEYTLKILGPAPKEGAARPVLHMMTFRPQESALRSSPTDPTPTVEVLLK